MSTLDPTSLPPAPPPNAPAPPVRAMPELAAHLATRRSSKPFHLLEPAPSPAQLAAILQLAVRVPDHGKLAPWRFVVFAGDGRARAGAAIAEVVALQPGAAEAAVDAMRAVFTRSALVVMVVSRAAPHPKIPEWEQVLSAGALCHNLILAAEAFGFGAVWLSGWPAYDPQARAALGVAPDERVAGFVHIGTQSQPADERDRPNAAALTTWF